MEFKTTIESIETLNKNLHVFYGVLGAVIFINILFMIVFFSIIKSVFKTWNKQNREFLKQMATDLLQATENSKIAAAQTHESIKLIQQMQVDYNNFIMNLASETKKKNIVTFVESVQKNQSDFLENSDRIYKKITKPSENIKNELKKVKEVASTILETTAEMPEPDDVGYWEEKTEEAYKEKSGIVEY